MSFNQFKGFIYDDEKILGMLKRREPIPMDLIISYKNKNQIDDRNFISIRVFSKKHKYLMQHHSLEKEARIGNTQLIGNVYTTYLPSNIECANSNFFTGMNSMCNGDRSTMTQVFITTASG